MVAPDQSPPSPLLSAPSADSRFNSNLARYVGILRRRLWIILAMVAVGATLAVLYTMRQPRVYAATATVVVNPQAPHVLGPDQDSVIDLGAGSYWSNQDYYNTQLDILTAFPLARATVSKRHGDGYFYDDLAPKALNPKLSDDERLDQAAEIFKGMLVVSQDRDSWILAITVSDTDPDLAKDLANEHVHSYLAATLAKRTVGADKSSHFLATELDAAEKQLREAEQALYKFKEDNDILSVSLEDKENILASDIQRFTGALGDARIKRIDLGGLRKRALGLQGEDVFQSPVFALASNSQTVDDLKKQYVDEHQKLLEMEGELGPKETRYIEQKKKVDDLHASIEAEATRATRELDEKYQAELSSEAALQVELDRLKKEALALGPLTVDYNRLVRQQKAAEDNYDHLIGRLNTSESESRNEQINVEENEYARAAYLIGPRMKINVSLAVMLSLIFGVGFALLLDYLDRTIKSADDVEQAVGAPLLGVIPIISEVPSGDDVKAQRDRDLYVFSNPTSRAAECCRSIRTNILFSSADRPMTTITVSSPRPREGKTTTTIYMGTIMAQSGQRVLLVDTDMRRPRLHKSLGVSKARGLTNLLLGDATVEDVVKSTDIPNLYVLPCGPQPPNPAEILLTKRFQQVLAELEQKYDRILLDSPPVLAVTDAVVLSRLTSGVIMVAQAGKTHLGDVAAAARQFKDVNAPILGVIMNDMDISDRRYGSYYYYYSYGSYGETAKTEA